MSSVLAPVPPTCLTPHLLLVTLLFLSLTYRAAILYSSVESRNSAGVRVCQASSDVGAVYEFMLSLLVYGHARHQTYLIEPQTPNAQSSGARHAHARHLETNGFHSKQNVCGQYVCVRLEENGSCEGAAQSAKQRLAAHCQRASPVRHRRHGGSHAGGGAGRVRRGCG